LSAYEFPARFISTDSLHERIEAVTAATASGWPVESDLIAYHAPWGSVHDLPANSLDLVFSQAVLQYVDALEDAYQSMFTWLKPGGYASHATGLGANDFSPFWNGHWAYSDREWQVVRGRREYMLNREPLSTHLRLAAAVGFDVLHVEPQYDRGGLSRDVLAERFRHLDFTDLAVRGAMMILRKPAAS
jgi:SAM-dependent methyltransferase